VSFFVGLRRFDRFVCLFVHSFIRLFHAGRTARVESASPLSGSGSRAATRAAESLTSSVSEARGAAASRGKARTLVPSLCRCRTALQRAKPSRRAPCQRGRDGWAHSRRGWGSGAAVPVPLRSRQYKQCSSIPCSAHARRACPLRRSAASRRRGSRSTPAPGTAQAQCRPRAVLVIGLVKLTAQRGY
jgi:hypothetical protein